MLSGERTVLEAIADAYWRGNLSALLGVDPNMPFEQFARWLRYGKKADGMRPDDQRYPNHTEPCDWCDEYKARLTVIKGDD